MHVVERGFRGHSFQFISCSERGSSNAYTLILEVSQQHAGRRGRADFRAYPLLTKPARSSPSAEVCILHRADFRAYPLLTKPARSSPSAEVCILHCAELRTLASIHSVAASIARCYLALEPG